MKIYQQELTLLIARCRDGQSHKKALPLFQMPVNNLENENENYL